MAKYTKQSILDELIDVKVYPFGKGDLTHTGIQWSDVATSAGTVYTTVEAITVELSEPGFIKEVEFYLVWAQAVDDTIDKAYGKAQARNKGGTWVDLLDPVLSSATGVGYEEKVYQGKFELTSDFNHVPFDCRIVVASSGTIDNAVGRVKSASWIETIFVTE